MVSPLERTCVICGRPFTPSHPAYRRTVCGEACAAERKRSAHAAGARDHIPTTAAGLRVCPCGATFPPEYDRLGRITSRRLCPSCRAVDSRTRGMSGRPDLPPDPPRCRACGCLTDPDLGGAQPGPDNLCFPCWDWDRRMATRRPAVARP